MLRSVYEKATMERRRHNNVIYPFTLDTLRAVIETPEDVKDDPLAFIEWWKKTKLDRTEMWLSYFSQHWYGVDGVKYTE